MSQRINARFEKNGVLNRKTKRKQELNTEISRFIALNVIPFIRNKCIQVAIELVDHF